ncbi:MAG: response regulator, partial [Nannocystaceae bacterium]
MTRVLIVDDNHELAENIAELLEDEGYETTVAFSSEQALALAKAATYELVLADIRMPGMNGVELIEVLGQLNPEATFLLMTAYTSDQMLAKAMQSGVEAVLPKPLAVERLLEIMPRRVDASLLLVEDDPTLVR